MAVEAEKLIVALEARTKAFENALARASNVANRQGRTIERRFQSLNKNVSTGIAGMAGGIGKAIAAVGGARAFQGLSDSATAIRNSLKVAGLAGEDLERTFGQLYETAQRNSVPIESLAQLFSRVSLVQDELGVSTEQLIGLTDNVGKALRISGADAQSASGALLQLAQALGSSKIQAEEYNSLIDTMPGLLQAAANGIEQAGGSVAKLTQLVKSGQISNKAFFDGQAAGAAILDQRLAGSVQTVAQRYITLSNALVKAADRFNSSTSAAGSLGAEFDRLAGYIDALDFEDLVKDLGAVVTVLEQAGGKAQAFAEAIGKLSGLRNIGSGIVDALGGENGKASFLGGLLTVEATATEAQKLKENAERRLSIEQQIAALKGAPASEEASRTIAKLEAQLAGIPKAAKQAGITLPAYALPGGTPLPATPAAKVDINDQRYKVTDDKEKSSRRSRLDDYLRETKLIRERTASLQAETDARALAGVIFEL